MRIEIAIDHVEAGQFVAFLVGLGHDAYVGSTTGSFVNGRWTSAHDGANETLAALWREYCEH